MIVDTSAVIAVLTDEPERACFEQIIALNDCEISSMSYLEASIVLLHKRGEGALTSLDTWIESAGIQIVPFTDAHARLARNAFIRFGKGRHQAGLNFGDCATYALAMDRDDPLLFRGSDFACTDIRQASTDITAHSDQQS